MIRFIPIKELRKFILIFYAVGTLGMLLPFTHALFIKLIPLNLLVTLVLIIAGEEYRGIRPLIYLILVALGGWAAEIAGVQTGLLFGEYSYGASLGPKLWDTPFLMTINWLVMVYGASVISLYLYRQKIMQIFFTGLLTVFFDIWMEPVAIRLDMWSWAGDSIPIQNYLMWFLLSVLFSLFFILPGQKGKNKLIVWLWCAQLVFFILLNIGFRILPHG